MMEIVNGFSFINLHGLFTKRCVLYLVFGVMLLTILKSFVLRGYLSMPLFV